MIRVKCVNKIQNMLPLHDVYSQEQRNNFPFLSTFWPSTFFKCNLHLRSGQSVGRCHDFFVLNRSGVILLPDGPLCYCLISSLHCSQFIQSYEITVNIMQVFHFKSPELMHLLSHQ